MKNTAAYYELTNLMGRYATYISCGAYDQMQELFAKDAALEIMHENPMHGRDAINDFFLARAEQATRRGTQEFFSVFGQLLEIREDGNEARCLWMFLSVIPDSQSSTASYQTGRIDQVCIRENDTFKIKSQRQIIRCNLEPIQWLPENNCIDPTISYYIPDAGCQTQFLTCDNDEEVGELLDVANIVSRYEQHLHCADWDKVDLQFSHLEDVSWTVGHGRKRFLEENPDYAREPDGPGNSEEPPYWMGARFGHESVMNDGFRGMVVPFSPENQGLYLSSDMLQPLIVKNEESGHIYVSAPSFGGFIQGPAMSKIIPYDVLFAFGRWHIEWVKEDGEWKMYHFFWSTFFEICVDKYDPRHKADWISTHQDVHDWPALPSPYVE